MRTWDIETEETTAGGRYEVTSDVLAAELGVEVAAVEGATVEQVQRLVDDAGEGFWQWAERYSDVQQASLTVVEDDPVCVCTVVDRGTVVLATSGRRSWLVRAVADHVRTAAADLGCGDVTGSSDEDLLTMWRGWAGRGCSVTLEPVVQPRESLKVRRTAGWTLRCWAPTTEVFLTMAEASTVLGLSTDMLDGVDEEYVQQVITARRHSPQVQECLLGTLAPRVTAVSTIHRKGVS